MYFIFLLSAAKENTQSQREVSYLIFCITLLISLTHRLQEK